MKASYFIGNGFFGQSEVHDQAHSAAMFCPHCGQIWARVVVESPSAPWDIYQNGCILHPNVYIYTQGQPHGSIIPELFIHCQDASAGSGLLLSNLPEGIIRREFDLLMSRMEIPQQTEEIV